MTQSTPTLTSTDTKRAARNAGALAMAGIFSKGMLFIWQFVLARWLGDAGYGIYGTVGAMATIATVIGSFGMGLIVVRDVSRNPHLAGKYLTAMLFMQTGLVLVAFLTMNLAALIIGYSSAIRVYIALTGVGLIIDIYGNMCSDHLLAQERMVTTSIVEAAHIAIRIGLVALALSGGYDLLGLYLAGLLAGVFRSSVFWWALAHTGIRPEFPLDRTIAFPLFVNSVPLAISAILTLAYQQADKLVSTRLLDESSTGYLTAAFVVIMAVIELLNSTILIATYPLMSRAYQSQNDTFGFIVQKLIFFSVLITLPICLTLSIFAPQITIPLFGADFSPTARILRVLIAYAMVAMIVNIFAQAMMVQNRQRQLLYIRVAGLTLNLTLNLTLLLAFQMDVMGLVYASVIAESVVLTALLLTFRQVGIDMMQLTLRLAWILVIGVFSGGIMLLFGTFHFIIGIVAGAIGYLLLTLRLPIVSSDDWDLLYRLTAAMPGGSIVLRHWKRDVALS